MPLMKATAAAPEILRPPYAAATGPALIPACIFLALLWGEVIRQLKPEWTLNPQYGYAWSVPLLCIYLLFKRWPERPAPSSSPPVGLCVLFLVAGIVFFLPIRFIAEANPDWRLLSWNFALLAVVETFLVVLLAGGTRWARHFAFPILFFLVAVPWPTLFEQLIIQGLMRAVTGINVAMLHLAGVPALQKGNVIEVGTGLIGIEEACSGVRSLQATFMVSLFLGELYSFSLIRRLVLVAAGALLAFLCNVVRTAILVWVGTASGPHAIEAWHDPAGLSILLVCLFGLWLLSMMMQRGMSSNAEPAAAPSLLGPILRMRPLLFGLAIGILATEAGVHFWYRAHQSPLVASRWSVQWPTSAAAYQTVPIAPEAQQLLHYNDGGGAAWQERGERRWLMYFFRWLPGQTAARFVKIHRPDICLPASGMTLVRDDGLQFVTVNGLKLPMRSYRFDNHGETLHVFYCYWDARSSYENAGTAAEEDWSAKGRINAALRGRRELGSQMLELIVQGYESDAEARQALEEHLSEIVIRG
jgi:exosortase